MMSRPQNLRIGVFPNIEKDGDTTISRGECIMQGDYPQGSRIMLKMKIEYKSKSDYRLIGNATVRITDILGVADGWAPLKPELLEDEMDFVGELAKIIIAEAKRRTVYRALSEKINKQ